MATFRPAVHKNDPYIQKVTKYIPGEIITGYIAVIGYLDIPDTGIPPHYITYYKIVLGLFLLITPAWTYYAVLDGSDGMESHQGRKNALFHAGVATVSFVIAVYAIQTPLLKFMLCGVQADCAYYSPVLGSVLLVIFTVLTPLLERIVLGTRLPA